jgi:catechol 2,3-dioxygenase-like lactoylglutathione lyase family enzyme
MAFLQLTALIVDDYDDAITFFTQALGFELAEDTPSRTNDGQPKRWVVVPVSAENPVTVSEQHVPGSRP